MDWKRVSNFNLANSSTEDWIYEDEVTEKKFNVNIKFGKPIDIISLKSNIISNLKTELKRIKESREFLYKKTTESVIECPICNSKEKVKVLEVYNAQYVNCKNCNHYYIDNRPNKNELEEFYEKNIHYQSTYADKDNLLTRVREVAEPKLNYIIKMYEMKYGKPPKSILDVGAGSGHFVYAARLRGIKADGVELSKHGCEFAKNNFNIELSSKDFIDCYKDFMDYDIITFWGVIEHIPYPLDMLIAAKKILNEREALIVAEVPRYESLSSEVQSINKDSIIRHLEPLGHINCLRILH